MGRGGVTSPKQEVALDTGEPHSVRTFACASEVIGEILGVKAFRQAIELKGGYI